MALVNFPSHRFRRFVYLICPDYQPPDSPRMWGEERLREQQRKDRVIPAAVHEVGPRSKYVVLQDASS